MPASEDPILLRMQDLIERWEAHADPRLVFLRCYRMMTANMLAAIQRQEFNDPGWVDRLLHSFAGYYFTALEKFEQHPASAPAVWQVAHHGAREAGLTDLQKLLLGVNAHINYDLVLSLSGLLRPEWPTHTPRQRSARHADHERVNAVIAATIDAVQDQVLSPGMPGLGLLDKLMGPLDERMISALITHWREDVWKHAAASLDAPDAPEQAQVVARCEAAALRNSEIISLRDISVWIRR